MDGTEAMQMQGCAWWRSVKAGLASVMLATLAASGGGEDSSENSSGTDGSGTASPMGTLSLSLTDSPACGYDNVWITVQKARVHRSSSASDDDAGWIDIPLPTTPPPAMPLRMDLLTLTNGVLVSLGRVQLPAGTYTQLRLVRAPDTAGDPYANAVKPNGASTVALTTPSAQQNGLKLNVQLSVPAGQEADFAIDFDACKSTVKAGKSGIRSRDAHRAGRQGDRRLGAGRGPGRACHAAFARCRHGFRALSCSGGQLRPSGQGTRPWRAKALASNGGLLEWMRTGAPGHLPSYTAGRFRAS
jgi:Domain of unknown function (DUF4382)